MTWAEDYEVRHVEDSEGGVWEHFRIDGSPTASPPARRIRKRCHQLTVTIAPRTHHEVISNVQLPDDHFTNDPSIDSQ